MNSLALGLVVVCAAFPPLVSGFSTGPPAGACSTLAPNPNANAHGAPPSTDPVPYILDLSDLEVTVEGNVIFGYIPGQQYILVSASCMISGVR